MNLVNSIHSSFKFHSFEKTDQVLLNNLIKSLSDYKTFKKQLEKKEYNKLAHAEIQELVIYLIQTVDFNGLTILEQAVLADERDMIELLLALKIDINTISSQKCTCGCFAKSKEQLLWLFNKGLLLEPTSKDQTLNIQARIYLISHLLQNFNKEDFESFLSAATDCQDLMYSKFHFYVKPERLKHFLLNSEVSLKKLHSLQFFKENAIQKILNQVFPLSALTGPKEFVDELYTLIKGLKFSNLEGLEEIIFFILSIPWQIYKYENFSDDLKKIFEENIDLLKDDLDLFCLEQKEFTATEKMWSWALLKSRTQEDLLQAIDHLYSFTIHDCKINSKQKQLIANFINTIFLKEKQNLFWKSLCDNYKTRFENLIQFLLDLGVDPFIRDPKTGKNLLHQILKLLFHSDTINTLYPYLLENYPNLILTVDRKNRTIVDKFHTIFKKSELLEENLNLLMKILKEMGDHEKSIADSGMISPHELNIIIKTNLSLLKLSSYQTPLKQVRHTSSRKFETEFFNNLSNYSTNDVLNYCFKLFKSKEAFEQFVALFKVTYLNLTQGGTVQHNYAKIINPLLERLSMTHLAKKKFLKLSQQPKPIIPKIMSAFEISVQDVESLGISTLMIKNKSSSKCEIFKFRNMELTFHSFAQERSLIEMLKHTKKLKSDLHEPVEIYIVKSIENAKFPFIINYSNFIYHFKMNLTATHYLHNIQDEDHYLKARSYFISDAVGLLKQGIRIGMGKYNEFDPVPDLFKTVGLTGATALRGGISLNQPSVIWEGGLGDITDGLLFLTPEEIKAKFKSSSMHEDKLEKAAWYKSIAMICFVDCIDVTLRFLKLNKLNWKNSNCNSNLAKEFVTGSIAIINCYTKFPMTGLHTMLADTLPWIQMAKEISFWVQNQASLPNNLDGLYPEEIALQFKNRSDCNDAFLGIPNGPLGLISAEMIFYIVSLLCLGLAEYRKVISKKI